ncbi:MAG: putative transcription initiation factor TFIID subunit [Streblomastix strix]|uniref:Putative transcription initiation factor TFIID subunit n=1 Tax=Streblomastix strix TaxID=222440 RepID=A0A5J4WVS2_9EUKA|nr:MAG: putative transcription initiation factor TFIID subunit [Streblomastix strix]
MEAQLSNAQFEDFFEGLGNAPSILPDELTDYYLRCAGCECPDIRVRRLIGVAAEKFMSDILGDAYQLSKTRDDRPGVLTVQDLSAALNEHGIHIDRPQYVAESSTTGNIAFPK